MNDDEEKLAFENLPTSGYPIWNAEALGEYFLVEPNPMKKLDKWSLVELKKIREGTANYRCVHHDTSKSKEAVYYKTLLFQMIAHKEGWTFNPERYKVTFLPPDNPVFKGLSDGLMRRVYEYKPEDKAEAELGLANLIGGSEQSLSSENRAGFVVANEDHGVRMENDESDDLSKKINEIFRESGGSK